MLEYPPTNYLFNYSLTVIHIPYTGRNNKLHFGKHKRILVLNKIDLADTNHNFKHINGDIPVIWTNCKRQHHPSVKIVITSSYYVIN